MGTETSDAADLLYGVPAIAKHLNLTCRAVYHLHSGERLPTFKIGGKVCARRSTLAAHFTAQEQATGRG